MLKDDEASSERVKALCAAWPEQVAGVRAEDCVFIDESGVNRAMTHRHARSRVNTRAFGSAPRNWGDNVEPPRCALPAPHPGADVRQRRD